VVSLSQALETAMVENMEARGALGAAREHGEQLQARLNELVRAHEEAAEGEEDSRKAAEPQSGAEVRGETRGDAEGYLYAMLQAERGHVVDLQTQLSVVTMERDAFVAELEKEHVFEQARNSRIHCSLRGMPVRLKEALDQVDYLHDAVKRLMAEKEELEEARRAAEAQRGTEGEVEDSAGGQMLEPMLGDLVELEEWPYFKDERLYVGMRGRVIAIGDEHDLGLVQTDIPCKFQTARAQGQTMWWSRTCVRVVERNVQMATEAQEGVQPGGEVSAVGDFGAALGLVLKGVEAEVWKRREERDKAKMQEEAVQVAAMAVRFVLDVI
jgi:hypothetical protein